MTFAQMGPLGAYALAGLVLGAASFASLKLTTDLYVAGPLWRPIALHVVRLSVLTAVMVLAALQGAGPLLALAAGVVIARPIAVRLLGRAP